MPRLLGGKETLHGIEKTLFGVDGVELPDEHGVLPNVGTLVRSPASLSAELRAVLLPCSPAVLPDAFVLVSRGRRNSRAGSGQLELVPLIRVAPVNH